MALAIALGFGFGYALTSLPLLRAGLAISAVIAIALASDTLSIATMELVDNVIMLAVPGAMEAGLGQVLFWGSLAFALVIAGAFAVPVNRWLLARGKGHAVVHETGIHGGLSPRLVGAVAALAFIFGTSVLVAEAANTGSDPARDARTTRRLADTPNDRLQLGAAHDLDPVRTPDPMRFKLFAVVAAAALINAGCGSDSDAASDKVPGNGTDRAFVGARSTTCATSSTTLAQHEPDACRRCHQPFPSCDGAG